MNRAWRSRAIRQIGFFAILAVLGLMVVRWYFFMRAQAMPTTLDMTYSNQQNNKRAGYTFTIGDAVYYPSRNGMGYMVQGREGKVSFSQCPAQESGRMSYIRKTIAIRTSFMCTARRRRLLF